MSNEHKPLTAAEIERLRELEAKATMGPWAFSPYGDENKYGVGVVMNENDEPVVGFDDTEDGIVVEAVAPEVEGYANAALISTMRNTLPRLLAMLTPPAEIAGGISSKGVERFMGRTPEDWVNMESWARARGYRGEGNKAPTDAEVRGPVRYEFRDGVNGFGMYESETGPYVPAKAYDTLLSHIRAAQAPRLTDAQVAALHITQLRCLEEGNLTDVVEILESTFPGVFGKEG